MSTPPPFAFGSSAFGVGAFGGSLIPGSLRVKAVVAGFYNGIFRDPGDIFDLLSANDYSDSTATINPPTDPDYPLFGWMLSVAQTTPLYSFALANGGASSNAVASMGTNSAGQKVWGNAGRYVA